MNRRFLYTHLWDLVEATKNRRQAEESGEFVEIEDVPLTTWYEWAMAPRVGTRADGTTKTLRWLPGRRRPAGESENEPREGVFYRVPMDHKQSHVLDPQSNPDDPWFFCGMSVWPPDIGWIESGASDALGVYLIEDTRKGGRCAECRRRLKAHAEFDAFMQRQRKQPESPLTEEEWERVMPHVRSTARADERRAEWLANEFNGEVVS